LRVTASSRFLRRAKKLREPHASMLRAALRRFAADPRDPLLRTHTLRGDLKGYWAFAVDDDLGVLLRWDDGLLKQLEDRLPGRVVARPGPIRLHQARRAPGNGST
jgi:mRNA-degrading endonuclease YafQ of YafQ-DinJ toxin-antitoxin module